MAKDLPKCMCSIIGENDKVATNLEEFIIIT
jgi:hypothetical protein